MKYLVVGLGNIGREYENTRHNIGFDVLDALAEKAGESFSPDTLGSIAAIKHRGRKMILLKPSTYMNRSGKAVRYWLQKEKIPQERLLVIVDDLNLPFGKVRIRGKGSDGGHNGLKDINAQLGNQNYARLRLGIGNEYSKGRQADYVLSPWSTEEEENLPDVLKAAAEACKTFVAIGLNHTMNQFNK